MNGAMYRSLSLAVVLMAVLAFGAVDDASTTGIADFAAVEKLLDVLDLVAAGNSDYEAESARLKLLSVPEAEQALAAAYARNCADGELQAAIDRLLALETYRLYYRQYRNMTAERHREIILHLPFEALPGPAGISENLQNLFEHRGAVRASINSLKARLNLAHSLEVAQNWLPQGISLTPRILFFYDGNGDAFARDGAIGYDLAGDFFNRRPEAVRFDPITDDEVHQIELTLAHECHHLGFYQLHPRRPLDALNRMLRDMVTEGLAMHCHPPSGVQLGAMTDTAVVESWLRQFELHVVALAKGELPATSFVAWRDSTYYELALEQLRGYFSRHRSADSSAILARAHSADRMPLVYSLGWWMVEEICSHGQNLPAAIDLAIQPDSLVVWYNRNVSDKAPRLALKL